MYRIYGLCFFLLASYSFAFGQNDKQKQFNSLQAKFISLGEIAVTSPSATNITESSVVINFSGYIPIACVVVYGESENFGFIAVDDSMGRSAVKEHRLELVDLKADTLYYYRLQGTAKDGMIYVGEVRTFRTTLNKDLSTINARQNLASISNGAKIISVSSNIGFQDNTGRWGANSAIDSDEKTAWSSNGDGNNAFVEIELSNMAQIDTIEFWTRSMSNNTAQIFSFTVTNEIGDTVGPFSLPDADKPFQFSVEIIARRLRFDVETSNGGNTGAIEIGAYGNPIS